MSEKDTTSRTEMSAARSTAPVEISYRPGPLAGLKTFRLENGVLSQRRGDAAPKWEVPLGRVTTAVLAEHTIQRRQFRRLDLKANGRWYSIGGNFYAGPLGDPEERQQRALIEVVTTDLPDGFPIVLGERGGWRHAWFGLGVFSLLMPVGILVMGIVTEVEWEKFAVVALPMLLLAAFGYAIAATFAPWRAARTVPAQAVGALIEQRATGTEPQDSVNRSPEPP